MDQRKLHRHSRPPRANHKPSRASAKTILYYAPTPAKAAATAHSLARVTATRMPRPHVAPLDRAVEGDLQWLALQRPSEARHALSTGYVHLVVLDLRWTKEVAQDFANFIERGREFLEALDSEGDIEARYGFHRILALVSGPQDAEVDRLIAELGTRRVGRILRHRADRDETRFFEEVADEIATLLVDRPKGKAALCASGGGTTGVYFELGVLKCLEDCFIGRSVNDFDMYFGISAGAVVSGMLASGYSVSEFMAAIAGDGGGRLKPVNMRVLQLKNVHYSDIFQRTARGLGSLAGDLAGFGTRRGRPGFESFLLEYADLIAAPFRSDSVERGLRTALTQEGMTNDFRKLERKLFIGATDHDAREHVLFGSEGYDHIPISRAIQASLSFNPVFSPVEIEGRMYVDGAITRTSDFVEAIKMEADLIFVIDPFVPYVSKVPGEKRRRGILYNIDQDLRTITYTRFENTRYWVLRQHPEVSCYTFLPSNTLRGLMGSNPMDPKPYLEIWRGAYLSTLQRLRTIEHRLAGDARPHGIQIDLSRANEVAARLTAAPDKLSLADFFPEGRVESSPPTSSERLAPEPCRVSIL